MTNILLEGYDIGAAWLYNELKEYIKPTHSVAVVAFSFRESRVKSITDWVCYMAKRMENSMPGSQVDFRRMEYLRTI